MGRKLVKAKVICQFYDSAAKVMRSRGDIIEVTPARFNEIAWKGRFIEPYTEPPKAEAAENE